MTTLVPIGHIDVGDNDRDDMGDIAALAESVAAVGLLHPLPMTSEWRLIAGHRRLAAVKSLGWSEVPVTVVDLTTVADVLRAEADENTCRKGFTPAEAERARERRARVLAEDAARRAAQAPGQPRGAKVSPPNLGDQTGGQVETRTAKVASRGTGYSGSTLDKVQAIREIAEQGVIKQGGATFPAPEPVRVAAREAYAHAERGDVPVDRLHREVAEAIEQHTRPDPAAERARQRKAWHDALGGTRAFREFDTALLPELLDADAWERGAAVVDELTAQAERFRAARATLRVVGKSSAS